jgi:hypothetical protein
MNSIFDRINIVNYASSISEKLPLPLGISLVIVFIISLAFYFFFAYCMQRIARKAHTRETWRAYIPVLNYFLTLDIAEMSHTWGVVYFSPIMVGFFAGSFFAFDAIDTPLQVRLVLWFIQAVNIIVGVYLWVRITKRLGRPIWLGFLMIIPLVNIFITPYLAFTDNVADSKNQTPA